MNELCEYCGVCSKIYSSNPLVDVPEGCCYSGEIFLKREEIKQKVRKFKEEIIYYEALIASGDKESKSYNRTKCKCNTNNQSNDLIYFIYT